MANNDSSYRDLREFIEKLREKNLLIDISETVDPNLEITEISHRVLKKKGPALLFNNPKNSSIPILTNLFGTTERVAYAMGGIDTNDLREIGKLLAYLKEPEPPKGFKEAWNKIPILKKILHMSPKVVSKALCQKNIINKENINLYDLPIQKCWPDDAGPLITWGLVTTKGTDKDRQNLGIYRQQLIGKNKLIMRWLSHRGGAIDLHDWQQKNPDNPFPISVVLGCDPATILAAVTPIPDTLAEYAYAGLLRGRKTELIKCLSNDLLVPARSEIILEGYIYPNEFAPEGPFGDHTGYYNEVDKFPVFTVEKITHRDDPIYHSTYTGRPPDECAILGLALNEMLIPVLQKQFPEITDFYLPPEGCSYRMAIVSINKKYPGHAKQIMMGVWSYLRQFMYTKFIVVVDNDINIRDWEDVIWAITTRIDPSRDTTLIENTPIDYLDFASPISGLGSKMGLDATNKWQGETNREWGKTIEMKSDIIKKVDKLCKKLNL